MQANDLQQILGGNLDLRPTTPINLGLVRHDLSAIEAHYVRGLTFPVCRCSGRERSRSSIAMPSTQKALTD